MVLFESVLLQEFLIITFFNFIKSCFSTLSKNHEDSIFYKLLFVTILGYSIISFFDFPSEKLVT